MARTCASAIPWPSAFLAVPDLEVGSVLVKALIFLSGTEAAGVVLGAHRFDELLAAAAAAALGQHLVDIDDVGGLAAFLVSDGARRITGTVIPVDGGQHMFA